MKKLDKATYKDTYNPLWVGNPLIESLPELLETDAVVKELYFDLNITEKERNYGTQRRCMMVSNLKYFFYPLNHHIELYYSIMNLIASGYAARNPIALENLKTIRNFSGFNPTTCHFSSMALIGLSGMGKSTTIEKILSIIPQTCMHKNYHGIKYYGIQVNWLKVDCSYDSSMGGFCREIFKALDQLLETDYLRTFGSERATISSMVNAIAKICADVNLGLLVIDEFQLIVNNRRNHDLNNFLTTFSNSTKVPLFVIGTPKAEKAFSEAFRTTRRYMDDGAQYWNRIQSPDDPMWEEWFKWLFDFQYTKTRTRYSEELSRKFYDYSQGVFSIASSLFRKVQSYVISNPEDIDEVITPEKVDYVFKAYFKPMEKVVEAIKNNDYKELEALEDMLIKIDRSSFNFPQKVSCSNATLEVQNSLEAAQIVNDRLKNEMVGILRSMELDIPDSSLEGLVDEVISRNPGLKESKLRTKIIDTALRARKPEKAEKPARDFSAIESQRGRELEFIE